MLSYNISVPKKKTHERSPAYLFKCFLHTSKCRDVFRMSRGAWAPGCNVLGTVYFREHIRGHLTIESDLIKKLDYDNIIDAFSNGKGRSKYF